MDKAVKRCMLLEFEPDKRKVGDIVYDMSIIQEGKKDSTNPEERLTKIGGTVGKGGIINKNDRYYSVLVYEKATERGQARVKAKKLLGEVDHPESGKGTLSKAAIRITKLYMEGDSCKYEAVILPTPSGAVLEGLLIGGVGVGVSSRGYGSYEWKDMNGRTVQVIHDDYEFRGIDVVLDQSNPAGSVDYFEDIEEEDENVDVKNWKELQEKYPDLAKVVMEDIKAELTPAIKAEVEKEFVPKIEAAKTEGVEEGKKAITESDDYRGMVNMLEGIKKLVPTTLAESESVTVVTSQLKTVQEELKNTKEKLAESEKKKTELEESAGKAVAEKTKNDAIEEACKDYKFSKILKERLIKMESAEEIKKKAADEKAFIEQMLKDNNDVLGRGEGEQHTEGESKGGKGGKENLTEEQIKQRKMAGIKD